MATAAPLPPPAAAPGWHPATRIAFRFCVLYFGLYVVLTQMLTSLLFVTTNDSGAFEVDNLKPIQAVVAWAARHVFRVAHPLVMVETGSGDRVYDWVELACILALALAGTLLWSWLDRRRTSYAGLYRWFHLFVRFSLAATFLTYGASKIMPLQMPFPSLYRLLEPYGNLSPMGALWSSIGAAPAYEIFAGAMEMLAGVLLIIPALSTLGALVGLADGVQVFMLNMTYDVPVKLLSFHLIPFSLFLLAPEARRLCDVLVRRRAVAAAPDLRVARGPRGRRWLLWTQLAFGAWLICGNLYMYESQISIYGWRRPHSALYGIWNTTVFSLDGQARPPLTTDHQRWQRVIFDSPNSMLTERMDGSFIGYNAQLDLSAGTLVLRQGKTTHGTLSIVRAAPAGNDQLTLGGTLDGHPLQARLTLYPLDKFVLVSRGFHWVQDRPYNN